MPQEVHPATELSNSARTLRDLIESGQGKVIEGLVHDGDRVAEIRFLPANARGAPGLKTEVRSAIDDAIDDLAQGAPLLRNNVLGVAWSPRGLHLFLLPVGTEPPANEVFSVRLRAFAIPELAQLDSQLTDEETCAAIYRLIVFAAVDAKRAA